MAAMFSLFGPTVCGQDIAPNRAENPSHLAATWQRFGNILCVRSWETERAQYVYVDIYICRSGCDANVYTAVRTLCCSASLIDYARVFQGLTDETREDLWDNDMGEHGRKTRKREERKRKGRKFILPRYDPSTCPSQKCKNDIKKF